MTYDHIKISGTNLINCPVLLCEKMFFNHTLFVQHHRRCIKADASNLLSFDRWCTNILIFFKHANECSANYATQLSFFSPSNVPNYSITNNKSNLLVFPESYFFGIRSHGRRIQKITIWLFPACHLLCSWQTCFWPISRSSA